MNEKDLLEQLKHSADDVTPPESLQPDRIEKMLQEQLHKEPSDKNKKEPVSSGKSAAPGKNPAGVFPSTAWQDWQPPSRW